MELEIWASDRNALKKSEFAAESNYTFNAESSDCHPNIQLLRISLGLENISHY